MGCIRLVSDLWKRWRCSDLLLNRVQRHLHERIEEQRQRTGKVRAIILKGRQEGCSTYVEGRFFWKVIHRRGVSYPDPQASRDGQSLRHSAALSGELPAAGAAHHGRGERQAARLLWGSTATIGWEPPGPRQWAGRI
jgi:hypothetical protein